MHKRVLGLLALKLAPHMSFASQPSLDFNPRQAARATDPVSSVEAAESIASRVAEDQALALKAFYENKDRDLDDFELEVITGVGQTSIGKRRWELREKGFIERAERRFSTSGLTTQKVYGHRITKAGIEYYEANQTEEKLCLKQA